MEGRKGGKREEWKEGQNEEGRMERKKEIGKERIWNGGGRLKEGRREGVNKRRREEGKKRRKEERETLIVQEERRAKRKGSALRRRRKLLIGRRTTEKLRNRG